MSGAIPGEAFLQAFVVIRKTGFILSEAYAYRPHITTC